MSQHPFRALQTTNTTGTGTLTLIAASSRDRSFQAALGSSSIVTEYLISGTTFYERGFGTYDGGSPGTLTRTTIIASSNGGAAVSLPAGTADVFVPAHPNWRGWRTGTGADTLGVSAFGETYCWSGSGAQTCTLPAIASCPPNIGWEFINAGTAVLTLDGNSTETINGATTIALYPNQRVMLFRRNVASGLSATAWIAPGHTERAPLIRTGTGTTSSGTATVTFGTAFPNGIVASSIMLTINSGSGTATLDPVFVASSPTASGFTVYCSAAAAYGFNYTCDGY